MRVQLFLPFVTISLVLVNMETCNCYNDDRGILKWNPLWLSYPKYSLPITDSARGYLYKRVRKLRFIVKVYSHNSLICHTTWATVVCSWRVSHHFRNGVHTTTYLITAPGIRHRTTSTNTPLNLWTRTTQPLEMMTGNQTTLPKMKQRIHTLVTNKCFPNHTPFLLW